MEREKEAQQYLLNNILDDDAKGEVRTEITRKRSTNYSAPPSITLYDYDDLEREILGDDNEEARDVCAKLPLPSPTKSSKRHKFSYDEFEEMGSKHLSNSSKVTAAYEQPQYPYYPYGYVPMVPYMAYHYPSSNEIHGSIIEVLNQVNEMAKERNNSKTIQYYFENGAADDKQLIFNELLKQPMLLAKDPFGNYVIQKVLEVGSHPQKQTLRKIFKGKIIELSLNSFGCRVIQRLIEALNPDSSQQGEFISEIIDKVETLIADQNGNHVIQKMFEYFPLEKTRILAETVLSNIDKIAFHAYGCRVLQKFLERGHGSPLLKKVLLKLTNMMIPLCKCLYGNYIMQYLVVHGPLEERNKILSDIKNNFVVLSLDKFASNVVEKAIINCNDQYRREILKILESPHVGEGNTQIGLVVLAKGQYSNYVVQRYLEYSNKQIQQGIMALICEGTLNFNCIKESQYGRHVLGQLEKFR